jgi:catechol 2,3-dioxygenase-like lactoylglutathione lyase family enzyme
VAAASLQRIPRKFRNREVSDRGPPAWETARVKLVDGIHHVTFLTEDMDRLLAFYARVFEAKVTLDMTEEGLRHAFVRVGPTTVLHPFQLLEGPGPPPPTPMFSRGRLDHFALLAPSEEAFRELRRRIEAENAADGDVRDMGSLWIMGFVDPDGAAHEVILQRPGFADSDTLERADWTTVTLE